MRDNFLLSIRYRSTRCPIRCYVIPEPKIRVRYFFYVQDQRFKSSAAPRIFQFQIFSERTNAETKHLRLYVKFKKQKKFTRSKNSRAAIRLASNILGSSASKNSRPEFSDCGEKKIRPRTQSESYSRRRRTAKRKRKREANISKTEIRNEK